jgi:hypothetical protein
VVGRVGLVEVDVGGLDGELPAVGQGIARIHHQVHQHLLDLARIGEHPLQLWIIEHGDLDVLPQQTTEQLDRGPWAPGSVAG